MKFIIFVIDGDGNPARPGEIAEIDAFNEKLRRDGNWITAAGIQSGQAGKVIDNRESRGSISPGSLFKGSEHYSGFWLIEADSDDIAEKLALEGSRACNRKVELRPFIR